MDSSYTYPKLRWPLDLQVQNLGEQSAVVIRCPLGINEQPLVLVSAVAPILSQLDGVKSFQQLLDYFTPQGVTSAVLEQLLKLLDENLFLSNSKFFAAMQGVKETFEQSAVRIPALAGLSYPSSPVALRQLVHGYLTPYESRAATHSLVGLVAPHIDYRRGGECYGKIYPRILDSRADVCVLIGTAHQYSPHLFHLCSKDFQSPLGSLACDRAAVSAIARRHGVERSFADQLLHRREHSLELQLPFLSLLMPGATVIPILVGSFHRMLSHHKHPFEWEEYESFAASLTECWRSLASDGKKVCFVAGVDMAHVGRAFGDPGSLTPERMQEIAKKDYEYLGMIKLGDRKALFEHVAEDQDARRICGFPTMYTVLDVMSRIGARFHCDTVAYEQAVDYTIDCAVTFAGVAMYEQTP